MDRPDHPDATPAASVPIPSLDDLQRLAAAEREQLTLLLDVLPLLVTVYDPTLVEGGRAAIRLNRTFVATLGWTEEDARTGDLMAACYPDPAVRAVAAAHMARPGAGWLECPTRARDGRSVPILWSNVTLAGGRQVGVGLDLTERDAARARAAAAEHVAGELEARLAAIVTSSQDAIVGHSPEGMVTSWNAAAERLFGYAAAELLGRSVLTLVPPERWADEAAVLARIARGEEVPPFESERVRKDGRRVPVSVAVSPVHDAGGRLVGVATVVRDGTAQRQAAEERERLLAAEAALRARAEGLQALTAALARAVTSADVVAAAVREAGRGLGSHGGLVALLDATGETFTLVAGPGIAPEVESSWARFPNTGDGPLPTAVRTRAPVYSRTRAEFVARSPRFAELAEQLAMEAEAALPLVVGDRTLGALSLVFGAPRDFGPEDDAFLRTVADLCAQALERARLYEAEHAAHARLALILDRLPIGVVVVDATGAVVHVNPASDRTLGLSPAPVAGLDGHTTVGGAAQTDGAPYAPGDPHPIARALWRGETVQQEITRYRHADGRERLVSISASPVRDGDGRTTYAVASVEDVTEREAARVALAERTAQLQAAMAHPGLVLGTVDLDLRYTSLFNPHPDFDPAHVLGHRDDELPGLTSEAAQALVAVKAVARDTGEPARAMIRTPLSDGDASFEILAHPIVDASGVVTGVTTVSLDVTTRERALAEREAAAARQRALFEQAPIPIATLRGPDHVGEVQNAAHRALVGGRDLVGRAIAEALPEFAAQGFVALLDRVYATGQPYVAVEVPAQVERGQGWPEECFITLLYQPLVEEGRVTGIMTVVLDVTDRVRARRELEGARAQAEALRAVAERERVGAVQANQSKSEFLANMSHELRTPLNAIGGHVQLVELGIHGPITPAQGEALGRVQLAQRHLLRLINDVLNFAKLEAGRIEFDVRATAPALVVREIVSLVEAQLRTKGLALEVCVPAEAEPDAATAAAWEVWADRDKLAQVLLNLLSNAIKFTPARRPDGAAGGVTVALTPAPDEPRAVTLEVRDTGIGIPADRLDAIFEPFVQVSAGLTRQFEGTGLGLAISRDLVRGMGGRLGVASVPGEGSTFTVTLRCARDADGAPTERRARIDRRQGLDRRGDERRGTPAGGVAPVREDGVRDRRAPR